MRKIKTASIFAIAGVSLLGCAADESVDELGQSVSENGSITRGQNAFNNAGFDGNGTTCATCHPSGPGESGTLNPAEIEALYQSDPDNVLFQHDRADVLGGNTFDRFRAHGTVLVELNLVAPNVRLVGSDARSVVVARGIPTTMNTPALDPVLMYDGREPSLQSQAQGAVSGHAQGGKVPDGLLDSIADFEQTLFNRDNLRAFFEEGTPVTLPYGTTESEQRGRRFFIADNSDNPDDVGESPAAKCGWCHSGTGLNGASKFFVDNIAPFPAPEGLRFTTALVSEINPLGRPVHEFEFTLPDGSTRVVESPDPGVAIRNGNPNLVGFFKSPTLWGVKDTAPYFHDNSSKTLEELMDHYDLALFLLSANNPNNPPIIDLTEQEKADILAYLKLL